MTTEDVQAVANAFAAQIDKSNAAFGIRDVLLLVGLEVLAMIAVLAVLGWFLVKYMMKKQSVDTPPPPLSQTSKDNELANRAHKEIVENGKDAFEVINRKDEIGLPILYGMTQAAKDIAIGIQSLDQKMTSLFNHQSHLWKDHDRDIRELKKESRERRNAT